jgi:predicted deacylase
MMRSSTPKRPSTAFTTVDLEKPGKQVGFVMFPHSPHDDAWGVTRVPIAVISNGTGPTVILEGGNHGDEYEGPIAICDLIRDLDPGQVQGRLILMPANNVHAVIAGRRTSPIDGLNFNRTFPGDPQSTITSQISAFINDRIYPLGDAFIDLHSGGSSLDILPSAIIEPTSDPDLHKRNVAAVRAFDAPMTIVISNLGEPRTATAAVSIDALQICRRGVRNVLAHLGVLPPDLASPRAGSNRILEIPGTTGYVFATMDGVLEPFHRNGKEVRAGEGAGRIHCTWDPARPPETVSFQADGILYARRQPGRVRAGNCCFVVASDYPGVPE